MSDVVVSVRGLSKRYALGPIRSPLSLPRWRRSRGQGQEQDEIWALKDVSFEVARGERIGIIGRNGAGKSTLLKILSRVVYPTKGEARIRGRVTSLLEVGTGFNDALSGRENIYLNASLHGLSRREIDERLEDIIDFSEVRRFIDSPVKHYSSGMRMRLAFSVAAHLDPDILMLDEVLAVGDLSFQRKCLERMNDLTAEGRTLLFVSHSPEAIVRFCNRCLWIDGGRILRDGPVEDVVSEYLQVMRGITPSTGDPPEPGPPASAQNESGDGTFEPTRLVHARIVDREGNTVTTVPVDKPVGVELTYDILDAGRIIEPALHIRTEEQVMAFVVAYTDALRPDSNTERGRYKTTAWIPGNLLNTGLYYVTIALTTPDPLQRHLTCENILSFFVHEPADPRGTARGRFGRKFPGPVRPLLEWETTIYAAKRPNVAVEG